MTQFLNRAAVEADMILREQRRQETERENQELKRRINALDVLIGKYALEITALRIQVGMLQAELNERNSDSRNLAVQRTE